jgi:two-component system, sporulation sensor kinase E
MMKRESNLEIALPNQQELANSLEEKYYPEKKLADLLQIAEDGIIFGDKTGKIMSVNAQACRILECTQEELIGKALKSLGVLNVGHYQQLVNDFQVCNAVKSQIFINVPSGKMKLVEFTCQIHESDGYFITIFRDITEKHELEKNVAASEQKFRRIFEDSMDGLILWDQNFRYIDVNSAAERLIGVSKEQLIGRTIYNSCKSKEAKKKVVEHLHQAIQNENITEIITINLGEGKKRYIEYSTKLNMLEGLNFTVFKDISEKIEMEEQLRKSDRLNVIGELAAGIAHEIRNPMTALKGFIQLLEGSIKREHEMYYQVITSELERIDSIINEFLILAKPQAIRFQQKDINQIVRETVDLLNAQAVLYNIEFKACYDSAIHTVYCEPNQLKKVFVNIIKNAIEVMPKGGTITISTERQGENYVHISIRDEGTGIPKEKIKKLGQPFFTTKERGTGLGLMVSYKIIEEHRGYIHIESEEGKGTTFHITLPVDLNNRNEN